MCMFICINKQKKSVFESAEVQTYPHTYINICVYMLYVNILYWFIFDFMYLLLKITTKFDFNLQRKAQLLLKKIFKHFEAPILELNGNVQFANTST